MSAKDPRPLAGYVELAIEQIHPNEDNPRTRLADIDDLAASIREHGLLQPVVVEPREEGGFRIIAGHRRHAALKLLARMWVPCIVRDAEDDANVTFAAMLVENGQRVDLNPIEQAKALRHLRDTTDKPLTEIARMVGRSQTWVTHRLQLLNLPTAEQQALVDGEATLGELQPIARAASPTRQPDRTYTVAVPHFTHSHPQVQAARIRCSQAEHPGRGAVAGGACHACWEAAIREDEHAKTLAALTDDAA